MALDRMAESIREGRFREEELDRLREEARDKYRRISIRRYSEPVSVFD